MEDWSLRSREVKVADFSIQQGALNLRRYGREIKAIQDLEVGNPE
jgi:hypothetical protein